MDIFKENERTANIYAARCMLAAAAFCLIIWLLNEMGIFIVSRRQMMAAMPLGISFFLLPTLAARLWQARPFCKYVILLFSALGLTVLAAMLTVHCLLAWPLLLLISCHYYSRKITVQCFLISVLCMTIALYAGLYFGVWDCNMMAQQGETVERVITSSILSRVTLFYLIPRVLILSALFSVCFMVAGRTRRLLEDQQKILREKERLSLDQKTGLYGVTAYYNRLDRLVQEAPAKHNLALCILDLDDFKRVNDTYGHAYGDEVILCLASIMKKLCGDRFFPARFGGEEFIILFSDGKRSEYLTLIKELLTEFSLSHYEFTDNTITVSAGLAIWRDGMDGKTLFEQADRALYRSKSSGKNRVTIYTEEMEKMICENHG